MYNEYVQEKLWELENERHARRVYETRPAATAPLAVVTRAAGGALKRLGERLETRAASGESERPLAWLPVRKDN